MLQDRKLVPRVEGDDRLQHCRQVFGLAQHGAPFVQSGILVPVEIIDEGISFARISSAPGPLCLRNRSLGSRQYSINGGIVDSGQILHVIPIVPSPSARIAAAGQITSAVVASFVPPDVMSDVCRSAQSGDWPAIRRQVRRTSRAIVSSWVGVRISFVASWRTRSSRWTSSPSIHSEAQASAKMRAFNPPLTDGRTGDTLVETSQGDTRVECRLHQGLSC
jgi:hypothetical protein